MTIVAYRAGIMAADTASWSGDMVSAYVRKIVRSPTGVLIGACGETADCRALLQWAEEGAHLAKCPKKISAQALIVAGDQAVHMCDNGKIYDVHGEFFAIGSGEDFALGAMAAGASAEEAVRLCFGRVAHVGGDVDVMRLAEPTMASIRMGVRRIW